MYIGIDVGGTFTDGVVIEKRRVIKSVKVPTRVDLTTSIELVLDKLLVNNDTQNIQRIVLSTTLITNLLAQGNPKQVGLILLPGPGINLEKYKFPTPHSIIKGAVDYRGRIIEEIDTTEVKKTVEQFMKMGIRRIAVACKFGQRNPALEKQITEYIKTNYPDIVTLASYTVNGQLNWIRRANGTAFTMMAADKYYAFIRQIQQALENRQISCPVHVLKADGGTMPLDISLRYPLEAIFSGPAASTLGALAAAGKEATCVVIDIGGTTTDLALILEGVPLMAGKGAVLYGYPVFSRAMAVSSLALGGDSSLVNNNGTLILGKRQGPAFCLGGPCLTVTDILVYLGISDIGSKEEITPQVVEFSHSIGLEPDKLADDVLNTFFNALEIRLNEMIMIWEEEPAYRIWQVLSEQKDRPRSLVCLGGPAQSLGTLWGNKKDWDVLVPIHSAVANAIGAALAKPTLRLDFFADTEQMNYSTNIGALSGNLPDRINNLDEAMSFAKELFKEALIEWKIKDIPIEIQYEEGFNTVRGWQTSGKIFQIGLQTVPGLESYLDREGEADE